MTPGEPPRGSFAADLADTLKVKNAGEGESTTTTTSRSPPLVALLDVRGARFYRYEGDPADAAGLVAFVQTALEGAAARAGMPGGALVVGLATPEEFTSRSILLGDSVIKSRVFRCF